MLLSEGSKFLAELRASAQVQQQNVALARLAASAPQPVMPAVHADPARPAPRNPRRAARRADRGPIRDRGWPAVARLGFRPGGEDVPRGAARRRGIRFGTDRSGFHPNAAQRHHRSAAHGHRNGPDQHRAETNAAIPRLQKFLAEFMAAVKEAADAEAKTPLPN